MLRNVNLSNLENVLQKIPRTDWVGEYIFRASGGTIFFLILPLSANHGGAHVGLMYIAVCPNKLWIRHCSPIVQVTFLCFKLNIKWTYCALKIKSMCKSYEGDALWRGFFKFPSEKVRHNNIPGRIGPLSSRERVYRLISKIMLLYEAFWVKVGM